MSSIVRRGRPWMITAALGLGYVVIAPTSADLAAASYRSDLVSRVGFTLWDNGWYGGHHLPAYSVLAPALGALLGPRLLAAVAATFAAALFAALIDGRFPRRASALAAVWFAAGVGVELLSGRVAFDLGLALGLGALLAAQRRRRAAALVLAVLCALASPVAGAFLGFAVLTWALATRKLGFLPLLAGATLLPILLLALAFPEGGSEPFAASSFFPALAGVLVLAALIPAGATSTLRTGALLYALALVLAYVLATPVGGNAVRLGALVAGPLAVCALGGVPKRTFALVALVPLLLYWQLVAPVRDYAAAAGDPSVHASYYAPLLDHLRSLQRGALRIEVPPTRNHWEARWVAPHVALARGWERQLDRAYNPLFYSSQPLTAARYRAWLVRNAIAYVALPDATLDSAARAEAKLLSSAQPYLREVWRSAHWRLFGVLAAQPLISPHAADPRARAPRAADSQAAAPRATLSSLGSDSFTLDVQRLGTFDVRVRFSPYWAVELGHGCVRRARGGWTQLDAHSSGELRVGIAFSLARVLGHGARCD